MTVLALPIQLRNNRVGAPVYLFYMEYVTMVAFLVLMVYLGSLAVKILQAPFGWFTFAGWSICLVIAVTKSYREIADVLKSLYQKALEQLLQVFDKLKELFMNIGASAGVVATGMFDKLKEFFMNIGPSARVIASGMFDRLEELVMGSDQPNGASASAGDVEITSAPV
ncbi:mitochondrial saccharopine dehydrogenase-like oxidoreductase [Pyrus ussuriensis x Pyrus communis]|uniref:Mitochondrial saccharopine dehydrogenase-like oxidoreductase n=1 Tax=Pyrus ussuriensis x Pyrus communis TaxID=2448454 RepID=A0A5N5G4J2_9ROSA|nr:mitochondrial saccharopine dehydrogenase-like oxidoreductase [Pyrus ussuriensis x Pyrus communis]